MGIPLAKVCRSQIFWTLQGFTITKMYASSNATSNKKNRWKRTIDGQLARQSTSSSTTVTNDDQSVATVSKISAVSLINNIADHDHHDAHIRGIYFDDGLRKIDFVLVFEEGLHIAQDDAALEKQRRRQFFEENLTKAGLELEEDAHKRHATQSTPAKIIVFVKVHAPWSVLCRQAEALKMRMPLQLQVRSSDVKVLERIVGLAKKYAL